MTDPSYPLVSRCNGREQMSFPSTDVTETTTPGQPSFVDRAIPEVEGCEPPFVRCSSNSSCLALPPQYESVVTAHVVYETEPAAPRRCSIPTNLASPDSFRFAVEHQSDVCPLSGEASSLYPPRYRAAFASSDISIPHPNSSPYGSPARRARIRGCHVPLFECVGTGACCRPRGRSINHWSTMPHF